MMQTETYEIEVNHATGVTKLSKMPGDCIAFKIPKDKMNAFLNSTNELNTCGVYLLIADSQKREVYVGESEPVAKRMKQHLQNPYFAWEEAIVFISSGNLTWGKGDIKYMEHGLFLELNKGNNYKLMNGNTPQQATVVHPNVWNNIIEGIKVLVPFLGHPKLFVHSAKVKVPQANPSTTVALPGVVKNKPKKSGKNEFKGMSAFVVQALMKHLFTNGMITANDIKDFTAPSSHLAFKIGSASACTMMTPYANQAKKVGGALRYYYDKYSFGGKDYALCSQLYPRSIPAFLNMALAHGLSESDVVNLCGSKNKTVKKFLAEIKAGNLK